VEQPPGLAGIDRPFSPAERVRVAIGFDDGSQGTFYTAFGDPEGKATAEEKAEMIRRDLQHPFIYVNMIVSPRGFTPVAWRQVMFATRHIHSMWVLREGEPDVDSKRGSYGR
jgi:hypothetical protein